MTTTTMSGRVRGLAASALVVAAVLLTAGPAPGGCDVFTAIVDLVRVLEAEHAVAQDLRRYIDREQERIDRLRK